MTMYLCASVRLLWWKYTSNLQEEDFNLAIWKIYASAPWYCSKWMLGSNIWILIFKWIRNEYSKFYSLRGFAETIILCGSGCFRTGACSDSEAGTVPAFLSSVSSTTIDTPLSSGCRAPPPAYRESLKCGPWFQDQSCIFLLNLNVPGSWCWHP